jgi:hypothetical protein
MTTIKVDILDDKAINLLKDLEALNIIRLRAENTEENAERVNFIAKYKGKMTKQSREEIDQQFNELRH